MFVEFVFMEFKKFCQIDSVLSVTNGLYVIFMCFEVIDQINKTGLCEQNFVICPAACHSVTFDL